TQPVYERLPLRLLPFLAAANILSFSDSAMDFLYFFCFFCAFFFFWVVLNKLRIEFFASVGGLGLLR
ncbi:hypothetical protein ACGK9U_15495, partial [Mariniflexile sp. HNIBRBA6329]|uniref:hypothetical protein n=1 Tax=Mariniflexile sp. HNIBRBA6329 TaxID=3373088 RepID=UPI0037461A21